jgi:hypothetical protein
LDDQRAENHTLADDALDPEQQAYNRQLLASIRAAMTDEEWHLYELRSAGEAWTVIGAKLQTFVPAPRKIE